jgi:hypothetical protein
LGKSSQHATSVHLILHSKTGHISLQFHCVLDDNFETLADLQRFQHLWPTGSPTDNNYGITAIPSNLDAPWFLH